MSFIGSLFSNRRGAGFQANTANMVNPLTAQQGADMYNQAYNQAQGGIGQQQAFVNALAAQGGLGNQANVFAQQQALANQLGQQAQGQGPNPAAQALAQSTGQNVANQAALMAGQRGTSANAGLLARQAAMQGGNLQQQAVGQGALMQAQQQIAAQQALANQQAQMAALAGQQVGQQQTGLNALNQASQGLQQNLQSGINAQNQAQLGVNQINAGIAANNQQNQARGLGGLLGGVGTGLASMAGIPAVKFAHGGEVPSEKSYVHDYFHGGVCMVEGGNVPGKAKVHGDNIKNDTVPAMLSPGEVVIPKHVMDSKDPAGMAKEFVKQVLARKAKK